MKNFVKWFGLIAFVAVIGFFFAACEDEPKDELNGTTWKATENGNTYVLTFNSPHFTISPDYSQKGTYTISGSTVTLDFDGDKARGKLSGNKLDFSGEGSLGLVFTKQ
jgi:hypothetical protein